MMVRSFSSDRCQGAGTHYECQQVGICFTQVAPTDCGFVFGLGSGVKDPIEGNWLDCYGLLREAEEELAAVL